MLVRALCSGKTYTGQCARSIFFKVEEFLGLPLHCMGMWLRCMVHSKKGIRNLSLLPGAPKCPKSYLSATDNEISEYANSLYSLLISDKKYMPKSWWSAVVVSILLALHLEHTSQFAAGEQSLEWLDGKSVACRMKFEKDQKNRESELKLKWQKEEEDHEEAAKNCKLVAESSIKLKDTLDKSSNAFTVSRSNSKVGIDDKLNSFKDEIIQQMNAREKAAEERLSSKLDEKFSELVRLLRGG
jgi:hypothetical protein